MARRDGPRRAIGTISALPSAAKSTRSKGVIHSQARGSRGGSARTSSSFENVAEGSARAARTEGYGRPSTASEKVATVSRRRGAYSETARASACWEKSSWRSPPTADAYACRSSNVDGATTSTLRQHYFVEGDKPSGRDVDGGVLHHPRPGRGPEAPTDRGVVEQLAKALRQLARDPGIERSAGPPLLHQVPGAPEGRGEAGHAAGHRL